MVVVLTTHEVSHAHLAGNAISRDLGLGCSVWLHLFDHGEVVWRLHNIAYSCVGR